jgi:protein-L-isoaspartate(D-aspartate) O-methyltransferase
MKKTALIFLSLLFICEAGAADREAEMARRRAALMKEIQEDYQWTEKYTGRAQMDPKVLAAMQKVPRHRFVSESLQVEAYENRPLPIGFGQTISQPYIVAIMTELLEIKPGDKALEIGTGSGYQAAVLAELIPKVYSIEIIPQLGESAKKRLDQLGYATVKTKVADGFFGWEEAAPFDAIIITAAASYIPPPLIKQLKPGGRMLIPIGTPFSVQQLMLVTKDSEGKLTTRQILPVRFVPLERSK